MKILRYTLRVPENEDAILEAYCKQIGRHKYEVLREYIRKLAAMTPSSRSLTEADLSDIRAIIHEEISQC